MADKPMIQLKDVSKIYDNGTVGLKDINLTINKGEFCALLGPSGSCKSTLLNIIGGIDSLDEGELIINKHHLKAMKEKELIQYRRDHLGYKLVAKNLQACLWDESYIIFT